jgi:hypothetical protein
MMSRAKRSLRGTCKGMNLSFLSDDRPDHLCEIFLRLHNFRCSHLQNYCLMPYRMHANTSYQRPGWTHVLEFLSSSDKQNSTYISYFYPASRNYLSQRQTCAISTDCSTILCCVKLLDSARNVRIKKLANKR